MVKRLAVVFAAAVMAAGLVAFSVAPAGAQTPRVFSCTFTVAPTSLPAGGGTVTVTGTAPGTSIVRIFVGGVLAGTTTSAPVTGTFSATVPITTSAEISVAVDGYPTTPCSGNQATLVAGVTASRLALTGSNDTKPIVLFALVAVSLGTVLVVAARRRTRVYGRS